MRIRAAAAFCLLLASTAHAAPNDYVRTPIVEEGEREIDFKTGTQRNRDGSRETAHSLGFGWGASSWWFTEVYVKTHTEPGQSNSLDAWEWENRFQLTETGRYPVDVGFLLEVERPKDRAEGYEFTLGPLLQAEWGKVQGNFNLLLQKNVRASTPIDTELHYQLQLKYRASQAFEWGAQAFGSAGRWDHWSPRPAQEHRFGPAAFGKIGAGAGTSRAIRWNAALLRGTTQGTPSTTLRMQVEYEF